MSDATPPSAPIRIAIGGGLSLAADIAGPSGAALVVLGHGGGQTRHSWDKAERELARAGYCAINYDLRGHGESDWSPSGLGYPLEARADDLAAVVAHGTGGDPAVPFALVGASLGGITALLAACRGLEPAALVLVDIVVQSAPAGVERIIAFMSASPNGFASLDAAADAISAYYPDRPRPKNLSGLSKNLRLHPDGRYRWHWDPQMLQDFGRTGSTLIENLEAATWTERVPTLLVRGMKSDIVDDAGVADLKARIPALEIADIGGAGHMVAGDKNDEFNAAVIAFLRRVMPA